MILLGYGYVNSGLLGFYGDYYFSYLILIVPALLIALWAQMRVKTTFSRYSKVYSRRGITAAQAARQILDANGLYHVAIERVSGNLTDHFDPRTNVVRLSESVYDSTSVASIGVAAHETGHAIQYATHYKPIVVRSAIVSVTNIGSSLSMPLIILGIIMSSYTLVVAGIILFSLITVFQLVTLPVEYNASNRAIAILSQSGILDQDEVAGAKKVLSAAALTYVAALITAVMQLLRLILLYGRRNND